MNKPIRRILLILSLLTMLGACKKQAPVSVDATVIRVDVKKQKTDETRPALSGYDYIILDSSDEALTGIIDRVEIEGDRIFITSAFNGGSSEVLIFDTGGRFIKKLLKGRGPKEIMLPGDIAIDRKNRKLVVLDFYNTIEEFDLDGNFLDRKDVGANNFYIESAGEGYLLYNPNTSKSNDALLTYRSKNGRMKKLLYPTYRGSAYQERDCFTPIGEDSVLVSSTFSNVIYLFDANSESLSPYVVFDYGSKGVADGDLSRFGSWSEYRSYAREHGKTTGPNMLGTLEGNLFFNPSVGEFIYGIHNFADSTTVLYDRLFEDLPNRYGTVGKTEDRIIFAYDPLRLLEYFEENPPVTEKAREIASRIKEDDNPVLILGHI